MSNDVETLLKELRAARRAMRLMRDQLRIMAGCAPVADMALKRLNATLREYRKPVALPSEVPNHE